MDGTDYYVQGAFPENDSSTADSHLLPKDKVLFERFKKEIQLFWRAPYQWGGASPSGADCSGLVATIYARAANIDLPHSTSDLFQIGNRIAPRSLRFADLVFFSENRGRRPTHVGIYIEKGYFLHASSSNGVRISKLRTPFYLNTFIGARRILE